MRRSCWMICAGWVWIGMKGPKRAMAKGPYGPYRQSERLEIYREHTDRLLAEGRAYRCFCSAEQLDREREQAIAAHLPQVYSGRCRNISPEDSASRAAAGEPFAVRLKIGIRPDRVSRHCSRSGGVCRGCSLGSNPGSLLGHAGLQLCRHDR